MARARIRCRLSFLPPLQRRTCRQLLRQRVKTDRLNPRQPRRTVDQILGSSKLRSNNLTYIEQFDALSITRLVVFVIPPRICHRRLSVLPLAGSVYQFAVVIASNVVLVIGRLPNKVSAADLVSTSMLKAISDLVGRSARCSIVHSL